MTKIFTFLIAALAFSNLNAQDSLNMKRHCVWASVNASAYNDCWGYTDENGREYAILGSNWGTHFIDITDPENPVEINSFEGNYNDVIWRDFKTYQHYAYGVADGASNSLQIFDLSNLPTSVTKIYDEIELSISTHNIYIDGDRLYLAINTDGNFTSPMSVISLTDPENPFNMVHLDYSLFNGYGIHDVYVKNDTAYCSAGNSGLFVYDLKDVDNPILISSITSYTGQGYNHSNWLHEDGELLVFADEVPNSLPLKLFDISDMSSPQEITTFISNNARPHNPYFVGDEIYISYYLDGLQVFNTTDPENPVKVAFYDTYPDNDTLANPYPNIFDGAWGTYPFFESRNIVIADITYGLSVVSKIQDAFIIKREMDICNKNSAAIDFKLKGNYSPTNMVYLEMSSDRGKFINPIVLDSMMTDSSGSFNVDLSTYIQQHSHLNNFKLRIRTSDPEVVQGDYLKLKDCQRIGGNVSEKNSDLFKIFPNPALGSFTILKTKNSDNANITLINAIGKEVIKTQMTNNQMRIDVSELPKGIYYVNFQNNELSETQKLIVK